jgi:hypothetical protein
MALGGVRASSNIVNRAMSFFVQVLNAFRIMLPAHFWLIWTTITTAAAICVALAVGHAATRVTREENKGAISVGLTWRQVGGPRAFAAIALTGRVPRGLRHDDFSVGRLCVLRQFEFYPRYP